MQVISIDVDLAKNVFQVQGVDSAGNVVIEGIRRLLLLVQRPLFDKPGSIRKSIR